MILRPGEKVFIAQRRYFEKDVRRHFVGEVEDCTDGTARIVGYVFVLGEKNEFERKPEKRTRVFSLTDGHLIINIIPGETRLNDVKYVFTDGRLHLVDGHCLDYDVDEFRAH